jgi:hypothetical protein
LKTTTTPAFNAGELTQRLKPTQYEEIANHDANTTVFVKVGETYHAVRHVVVDCTVGEKPVLVIVPDTVGVSRDALVMGWRPGASWEIRA